mmetsp:Transcript_21499/g.47699  ORF Transcript_21499/g.47699 Transcript_21499/m.47699 type:complete len:99 (+) Transcript_21499:174-470(+)
MLFLVLPRALLKRKTRATKLGASERGGDLRLHLQRRRPQTSASASRDPWSGSQRAQRLSLGAGGGSGAVSSSRRWKCTTSLGSLMGPAPFTFTGVTLA